MIRAQRDGSPLFRLFLLPGMNGSAFYGHAFLLWLWPLLLTLGGDGCDDDADPLRGTWVVVETIEEGRESERNRDSRFTFERGRVTFEIHDRRTEDVEWDSGSYVIVSDVEPKRIDLEVKGHRFQGIYAIEDDMLTICYYTNAKERPARFTPESTKDLMIFRLRRDDE